MVCDLKTPAEINDGWDGTIGNKGVNDAAPGVYYYVIEYTPKKPTNAPSPTEPAYQQKSEKRFLHLYR